MEKLDPTFYMKYGNLGLSFLVIIIMAGLVWWMISGYRKDVKAISIKTDLRTDQVIEMAKDFSKVVEKNTSVISQNNTVIEMCKHKKEGV